MDLIHNDTTTMHSLSSSDSPIRFSTGFIPDGCVQQELVDYVPWDNHDDLVSDETEMLVDKIKMVYVLPVLGIIGVPSNVINMAVFAKQGLKERINLCLFALSFADMIYMAQNMVRIGERLNPKVRFEAVQSFMVNHNLIGLFGFAWVSQFMSAVIASERCFCILFPLHSKSLLTTSTMAVIIVIAFVIIVGGYFVVAFRFSVICVYDGFTNTSILIMSTSKFYQKHQEAIDLLDFTVYGLLLPGVFVLTVTVTTVIISIKLKRLLDWRASTSSNTSSARQVALTRMLNCTSCLFVACFLPNFVFHLVCLFVKDLRNGKRYNNLYYVLIGSMDLASFVYCSLNFFVYYFMGSKYRNTFWEIFALCRISSKWLKPQLQSGSVPQRNPESKNTQVSVVTSGSL